MSKTIHLVPVKGFKVRHPQGGYLAEEGASVVLDSYWRRRISEGSVTEGKAPGTNKGTQE